MADIERSSHVEHIGEFIRITRDEERPAIFCFPEWSAYVTAYARIKLHKAMVETDPIYVDTDSLLTKKTMPESKALGDLKLEMRIRYGYIIKPKFYAIVSDGLDDDGNPLEYVKAKGVGCKLKMTNLMMMVSSGEPLEVMYPRFITFKDAIRRGLIPNEIRLIVKRLTLDDNKRDWEAPIDFTRLVSSRPRRVIIGRETQAILCVPSSQGIG